MFAKVMSAGLMGIEGYPVEVETNAVNGIPGISIVGALSNETRESLFRVSNALKNLKVKDEPKKITVNLSPADRRKNGTAYDLAIAVSVLASNGAYGEGFREKLTRFAFFGELGLDGSLKPVKGILPLSFTIKKSGITEIIVPYENACEAILVGGLRVWGCRSLKACIDIINGVENEDAVLFEGTGGDEAGAVDYGMDFSDVHGQEYLKRAAFIAVAGRHNILFSGPAGTGKTMIARRMTTIMPDLTRLEDIEVSKIYSICGLLPQGRALFTKRPFRQPHHGITQAAFAGGGADVMPGEISLASSGILFLDELPLFPRDVLETLRQPMEEKKITVSRMKGSYTYPADFQLVAAMNNCACGYYPDKKKCTCSPAQVKAYVGRLSKPLLERIDICAEARPLSFEEFVHGGSDRENRETSEDIKRKVIRAFEIQAERFRDEENILFNSGMRINEIEKYCVLGKAEEALMKGIFEKKELSGRTYHKILKVARTIADTCESKKIEKEHLLEAVELRSIEDKLFKKKGGAYHEVQ
ncbi:MAG: YifB family Mg chelatase-like AAA ATPase [Eubacteriales bacterium]|nr:YifB family Mg chelatase-like AAA ATPase [Eubacteriales bacterium]